MVGSGVFFTTPGYLHIADAPSWWAWELLIVRSKALQLYVGNELGRVLLLCSLFCCISSIRYYNNFYQNLRNKRIPYLMYCLEKCIFPKLP